MRYRHLGSSGLEVSEIGLGGNSFGERLSAAESRAIIHAAIDEGITLIDTSNVYADGVSERYIGRAVRGRREAVVIATKFGSRREPGPNLFGGGRKFVMKAAEDSLSRLGTDYIDLYQVHRPDPRLPIDETLRAMDDLIRQGKVRYIGCCNFEAWRLVEAVWTSDTRNLHRFISSQFEYSLVNRSSEQEMVPVCRKYGTGIVPYFPLAQGLLTGKIGRGSAPPVGTRLAADDRARARRLTKANFNLIDRLRAFSEARGHTMTDLAFAWLLANPLVGSVIAGARSTEQVSQNAAAAGWRLSPAEKAEVDALAAGLAPREPGQHYYSVAGYFSDPVDLPPPASR